MKTFPTNICNWMDAFLSAIEKSSKLVDIRNFINRKRLPMADPATAAGVFCMVCEDEVSKVIDGNYKLANTEADRKLVEEFFAELVAQRNNSINKGITKVEMELCDR